MKKISLVSSCYNEEENIDVLYERTMKSIESFEKKYEFEYILLDNGSTDNTAEKLRELAQKDSRVKVILNARIDSGIYRKMGTGLQDCTGSKNREQRIFDFLFGKKCLL